MDNPLITIFIPTYRRPQMLKEAIASCRSQKYSNLQVVVLDNASCDETPEIVKKIAQEDPRVVYVGHVQHITMLENYQSALDRVESEFFSFLSDDDLLLPHFIATALQGFSRFPDIAFFAASTAIICLEKKQVNAIPLDSWPREGYFSPSEALPILVENFPVPTTILFQREKALKASIDFHNPLAWDCDFLLQLTERFPIGISKQLMGIFRSHAGSFSKTKSFQEAFYRILKRIELSPWIEKEQLEQVIPSIQRRLYYYELKKVVDHLRAGKSQEAAQLASELLSNSPPTMLSKPLPLYWIARGWNKIPLLPTAFFFLLKIRKSLTKMISLDVLEKRIECEMPQRDLAFNTKKRKVP